MHGLNINCVIVVVLSVLTLLFPCPQVFHVPTFTLRACTAWRSYSLKLLGDQILRDESLILFVQVYTVSLGVVVESWGPLLFILLILKLRLQVLLRTHIWHPSESGTMVRASSLMRIIYFRNNFIIFAITTHLLQSSLSRFFQSLVD